ncbi:carbon storage regulator [Planctomicrobium sp.]|nr:carbon storage regulator [Planctomicrobium sp.]MBT5020708.1 carbon storage regulator [Planctomicrobium sp.]MDA7503636.1 carbon storage regulator [bacterium]MDB4743305.1 carbon storage regulator [Planctomicrobium sp.]
MLVLTRKAGETIHIGDDVVLKVSEVSGNRVKICIDAPKVLRILRGEVAEQMELNVIESSSAKTKAPRRIQSGSHGNLSVIAK